MSAFHKKVKAIIILATILLCGCHSNDDVEFLTKKYDEARNKTIKLIDIEYSQEFFSELIKNNDVIDFLNAKVYVKTENSNSDNMTIDYRINNDYNNIITEYKYIYENGMLVINDDMINPIYLSPEAATKQLKSGEIYFYELNEDDLKKAIYTDANNFELDLKNDFDNVKTIIKKAQLDMLIQNYAYSIENVNCLLIKTKLNLKEEYIDFQYIDYDFDIRINSNTLNLKGYMKINLE